MPAHWKAELIPVPLVGGALSPEGIRGSCVPGGSLGSLFTDGAVIPPGLLFALGLLSADGWGQIFPKWPPPKRQLLNILESFAFNVLPPPQATFTPVFPDVLQELQSGLTQIPMETLICPGTQCT